jgi:hypothetical protein
MTFSPEDEVSYEPPAVEVLGSIGDLTHGTLTPGADVAGVLGS